MTINQGKRIKISYRVGVDNNLLIDIEGNGIFKSVYIG